MQGRKKEKRTAFRLQNKLVFEALKPPELHVCAPKSEKKKTHLM